MHKLTASLELLHSVFILSLFTGLLVVAGLTVWVLNPIPFERYAEFDRQQTDYLTAEQQFARVAGVVSVGDSAIAYEPLIDSEFVSYELRAEEERLVANVTSAEKTAVLAQDSTLKLFVLQNPEPQAQTYLVQFDYETDSSLEATLQAAPVSARLVDSNSNSYEIRLPANSATEVELFRDYNEISDLGNEFSLKLVVTEGAFDSNDSPGTNENDPGGENQVDTRLEVVP